MPPVSATGTSPDIVTSQGATEAPGHACAVRAPISSDGAAPPRRSFDAYLQETTNLFAELLEITRTSLSGVDVSPDEADRVLSEYVRTPDPLAVLTDRGWRLSATRLCGLGALVVSVENADALMPLLQQTQDEGRADDPCLSPCFRAVSQRASDQN